MQDDKHLRADAQALRELNVKIGDAENRGASKTEKMYREFFLALEETEGPL